MFLNVINQVKMKVLYCCVLVIGLFYLINIYDVTIVLASPEKNEGYRIQTRWYERSSDNGQVSIKFAKVIGTEGSTNFKDINYYLERDAFWLAASIFIPREIMEESDTILQAINMVKNQDIDISYRILYQDEELLSIIIEGWSIDYNETGEAVAFCDDSIFMVFDMKTGKKLELSDFVELDMRIIDYKADNYEAPNYNSAAQTLYYSVEDAFGIYESEKYEHHNFMDREEALLRLKEGEIEWAVKDDKNLFLSYYNRDDTETWIVIPYSYIQDFAHY